MKSRIRHLIPRFLIDFYMRIQLFKDQRWNTNKSVEEIFTKIYKKSKWGGSQGEFYSGPGSTDERVVMAYISAISDKASSEKFSNLSFVDLGCGDFQIGRKLIPLCSSYTGVDIVKPLIQINKKKYGNDVIHFMHLNIVEDELPNGDVCFVRQVLQHLSNKQILAVLPKLERYKWVFITEHYPTDNSRIKPNIDKICGAEVRAYQNSGVYLTEPPINLPTQALELVLEVPGLALGKRNDPGVIRTFLYKPGD